MTARHYRLVRCGSAEEREHWGYGPGANHEGDDGAHEH